MFFSKSHDKSIIPHPHHGANNNFKKFIILTYPRTGSHSLIFNLRNSGNVVGYGELFHSKNNFRTLYPDFNPGDRMASFRNRHPEKFLNYIFSQYEDSVSAVGFKINYNQHDSFKKANLINLLNDNFDVKWIHLKRRNVFLSYISLKLMELTNICFAIKPEFEDDFSKSTTKFIKLEQLKDYKPNITIIPDELIRYIETIKINSDKFNTYLKDFTCLDLYYEDFEKDISETISSVSLLLFNDICTIKSNKTDFDPIVKLNNFYPKSIIKNYKEIRKALNDNGYSHMIVE